MVRIAAAGKAADPLSHDRPSCHSFIRNRPSAPDTTRGASMTPLPAAAGEPGVQRGPAAPHRGGAPGRARPLAPPQSGDCHHERLELAVEATELGLWEWDIRTGELF